MQYKIPVQIENEDTIIGNLSLRQIIIMMVWWWIGYSLFKSLEPRIGWEIALIPAATFWIVGIVIALMKISEMTFLAVMLNFIRLQLTSKERKWEKWVDSFSELEIGYVLPVNSVQTKNLSKWSIDALMNQDSHDKLNKI